jgi:hypothetical protein
MDIKEKIEHVTACICAFATAADVPAWLWDAASYLICIQSRLDAFC